MIVTKKMLESEGLAPLFLHCKNTQTAKAEILELLSEELGDGQIYSEQDICEQMRKIICKYE